MKSWLCAFSSVLHALYFSWPSKLLHLGTFENLCPGNSNSYRNKIHMIHFKISRGLYKMRARRTKSEHHRHPGFWMHELQSGWISQRRSQVTKFMKKWTAKIALDNSIFASYNVKTRLCFTLNCTCWLGYMELCDIAVYRFLYGYSSVQCPLDAPVLYVRSIKCMYYMLYVQRKWEIAMCW